MTRLLFVTWPEAGHFLPMAEMAAAARQRGFDVMMAGIPDGAALAERAGLPYHPIFADAFPTGTLDRVRKTRDLRGVWALARSANEFMAGLAAGSMRSVVRNLSPDLCLVDAIVFFLALGAYAESIPAAVVQTSYSTGPHDGLPPIDSSLIPQPTWSYQCARRLSALRRDVVVASVHSTRRMLGINVPLRSWVRSIAAASGYPASEVRTKLPASQMLSMLPQLLLMPAELDFPHPPRRGHYALGPFPPLPQDDAPFDWSALDPSRRLIYCSAGLSQAGTYGQRSIRVFQSVARAVALDRNLQLVIAAGSRVEDVKNAVGDRALVIAEAPQRALLARASLFVTHAGPASVRESVLCGVPMVAYPMTFDQKGTAARVAFHGLGLTAAPRSATAESASELIRRVLGDPGYSQRVAVVQSTLRRRCDEGGHIEILRELADTSVRSSASVGCA